MSIYIYTTSLSVFGFTPFEYLVKPREPGNHGNQGTKESREPREPGNHGNQGTKEPREPWEPGNQGNEGTRGTREQMLLFISKHKTYYSTSQLSTVIFIHIMEQDVDMFMAY